MPVRGYIDGVIAGEIVGWALDDDRPGATVRVSAVIDGEAIGEAIANQARGDLVAAGVGSGRHGFRIPFGERRLAPGTHRLSVQVTGAGADLPLASDYVVHDDDDAPVPGVVLEAGTAQAGRPSPRPRSAQVGLLGAGNWIFSIPEDGLDARRGLARVSHADLDAEVAAVEELFALAAQAEAIACYAELPDKLQLYAEHLPAGMEVDAAGRWGRHVVARVRDSTRAHALDLFDPLADARHHGRVFSRTGRELTELGAFHAYRAIAKQLALANPLLAPLPVKEAQLGPLKPVADSLVDEPLTVWTGGEVVRIEGLARPIPEDREPTVKVSGSVSDRLASLLFVHDGGGARVGSFLGRHFARRKVVEGVAVSERDVRKARPDVIVMLRSDR